MDGTTLAEAMGHTINQGAYDAYAGPFTAALITAQCTTVNRVAMFCAQIGHESAGLRYMEEIASGAAYEGRRDLGNTQPGDGVRFKGRGPIQLTGRANYLAFGRWCRTLGMVNTDDTFVRDPGSVATPRWGFLAAAWYWTVARPQLNTLADRADIAGATRAVNGGTNGLPDRAARWAHCRAMGNQLLPPPPAPAPAPAAVEVSATVPTTPLDGLTPAFNHYDVRALGWPVGDPSVIVGFTYRGVSFPGGVHRDTVPIWTALLDRLTALGVVLKPPGCWGYNNRPIRGGGIPSFHSAGLALDVNAPDNPYSASGAPSRHALPDSVGPVARSLGMEWGGNWTSPKDYMHFELHLNPDQARVLAGRLAHPVARPAQPNLPSDEVEDPMLPVLNYNDGYQGTTRGGVHWWVMSLQALLNVRGLSIQVGTTGEFDKDTAKAVRELQQTRGLPVTGTVDAATWAVALGNDAPDYVGTAQ